jgi:hypothetical protein
MNDVVEMLGIGSICGQEVVWKWVLKWGTN